MEASVAAIRKGANDFMGWWFGELSAQVPTSLRRALQPAERTIAVTFDEIGISLTRIEGGNVDHLGQFAINMDSLGTSRRQLDQLVAKFPAARWRWGLYLSDDAVLRDRLNLPIAAKENFYEAVEFQVNRQTPFQRNEIYFDCRPVAGDTTDRTFWVDYIIAPLDKIDTAVGRIASMGIPVDFVTTVAELATGQPQFNLLANQNPPHINPGKKLNFRLAVVAMLMVGTILYLTLENDRQYAAALSAQVERQRNEARVASRLRSEIAVEERSMNYVLNLKREKDPVVKILNDLTRLLPDDSWASQFTYKGGIIEIDVRAPDFSSIVRLVEGSDLFSGVEMKGAVRKDPNTNRDRFRLEFSAKTWGQP